MKDTDKEKIEKILESPLDEVIINYKKSPSSIDDETDGMSISEDIRSAAPDNYKINYSLSVHKPSGEKALVHEVIRDHLGLTTDTTAETITKIDFPELMSKFEIIAKDGERELNENLTDLTLKEEIDKSYYELLGSNLANKIHNKIEDTKNDDRPTN